MLALDGGSRPVVTNSDGRPEAAGNLRELACQYSLITSDLPPGGKLLFLPFAFSPSLLPFLKIERALCYVWRIMIRLLPFINFHYSADNTPA